MKRREAKKNIKKIVDKYETILKQDKIESFNEAQTRNEFIEPLFEFLGWDMRNLNNQNEVTTEESVSKGRVDLAFRYFNIPVMFLEAKSLKVDLDEWKWAEQAINYSWNKSVTWAVLTDFEGIKVFNAEIPPKNLSSNLFFELKWNEYIDRFEQLWLLSKESFRKGLLSKEAEKWGKLTKRKQVGEKLFEDLTKWRNEFTKGFNKSNQLTGEELDEGVQRILDRLIFIRTAEDRKIEENVLLSLIRTWESGGKRRRLYKMLAKVFRDFDDGYNSKLFALHYCEKWEIDDKIIKSIIQGLYKTNDGYRYDFSVIRADVLGGIYEQYLGHVLEQAKKRAKVTSKHTKRKSQGIYYTPKYIVSYIVKETLGKLLKEIKRKDLSKIKVLDLACGSGSFISTAFDELIEYQEEESGQINLLSRFDILKDNIYGVDLDEKAVEIAQLNLLLKVLIRRAKLPTLQNNIRTGNSLISGTESELEDYFGKNSKNIKTFNWEDEFKKVFKDGGFDVIIGNPPYIRQEEIKEHKEYFKENFPNTYSGTADLYVYFFERSMQLLKENGYFGFIVSNKFIRSGYGKNLRKYLQENFTILQLIDKFKNKVFADATVDPCIIIIQKKKPRKNSKVLYNYKTKVPQISLSDKGWTFATEEELNLKKKIESKGKKIKDWEKVDIFRGVVTGFNKAYIVNEETKDHLIKLDSANKDIIKPLIKGKNLSKYLLKFNNEYLVKVTPQTNIKEYPHVLDYLKEYKDELAQRYEPKNGKIEWYQLRPCVYYDIFEDNKIIYPDISQDGGFYWDDEGFYFNNTVYMIAGQVKKSWLAILNSKLMSWYYKQIASGLGDKGVRYFTQFVKELPIPENTEIFEKDVNKMLKLKKQLQNTSENTDKWNKLKKQIQELDERINEKVHKLYGLSKEEIDIIENKEI